MDQEKSESKIAKTAKILSAVQTIILRGIGASGAIAKYGSYIFDSYAINCTYIDDPFISVPDYDFSNAAIILLSISGNSDQLIESAFSYHEKDAYIIAITNSEDSPLAKIADESYTHYLIETHYSVHNTTTQIPTIFVLETLAKKTRALIDEQKTLLTKQDSQ